MGRQYTLLTNQNETTKKQHQLSTNGQKAYITEKQENSIFYQEMGTPYTSGLGIVKHLKKPQTM